MLLPQIPEPFRKNSDGSWTCQAVTVISGPLVRVSIKPSMTFKPGSFFAGVDIAAKLDAKLAQDEHG